MSIIPDYIFDSYGLIGSDFFFQAEDGIRDIAVGETLQIQATDPSTERDIPRFCVFLGHELLEHTAVDGHYIYIIRKLASD